MLVALLDARLRWVVIPCLPPMVLTDESDADDDDDADFDDEDDGDASSPRDDEMST